LALDSIIKQGIVFESFANKKRLFKRKSRKIGKIDQAYAPPSDRRRTYFGSILPTLIKFPREYSEEPKVIFYSGTEGIKNVILEVSGCPHSWYFFGSSTKVWEKLAKLGEWIFLKRLALRRNPDVRKFFLLPMPVFCR